MMLPIPMEYIVLGGLLLIIIILAVWIVHLEKRIVHIMRGKKAASLEDTINDLIQETDTLKKHQHILEEKHGITEKKLASSVRGVSTVRFNPFKGSGSNQSFATAFVDQHGNGVIISSLYSRERVSVFAKPIKQLESRYELTDEERKAMQQAHTAAE